jgi:hypothetical protein
MDADRKRVLPVYVRLFKVVPLILVLAACAGQKAEMMPAAAALRPGLNLPARFEPEDRTLRLAPEDTLAGGGCLSPLVDPRDDTVVRLHRSATGIGDYEVAGDRYGPPEPSLLRIECNTGHPLGWVPR